MKNIFKKIYIHPLMFFFLLIILVTGNFKNYYLFIVIILTHETGHILFALLFKWHIDKILILPFGMITFFKDNLNKPIYQEFIILLMGPLFQIILYLLTNNPYHYFLLFINLLPIYPLDGSKFLFLIFNKIGSYYKSYIMIFTISFIAIIVIALKRQMLIIYIMIFYLFINIIRSIRGLNDTLISFCFDRYKHKYLFKKCITLNIFSIKNLMRDRYHFFKCENKVVSEDEIFAKMFDKTR